MERITPKQVISMMEAVAQVYEQPEVEQLDEVSLNPMSSADVREKAIERMKSQGMTQAQIDKALAAMDKSAEEKSADAKVAREKRDRQAPGGLGTDGRSGALGQLIRTIQKTGVTGDEGAQAARDYDAAAKILLKDPKNRGPRGELTASTEDIRSEIQRIRDARFAKKPETETETKPAETKPASRTAPAGAFNISPKGSDKRAELEAQIKRDNAARTDDQRVQPRSTKPQPTDQQRVRTEYDRLRNSKDPKERAQAVRYGRQMAAAGAAKKDFSGYQDNADAKKNLPAPAQRTSIAQRLQAIRDMRAASQSRIAAQGGKPATPAANPTPKAAPPPVPSTTSTSTTPVSKSVQTKPVQATKPASNTIRNPMKDNMQVGSNTYKPGEKMSAADSASVRDAQSQIRANMGSNQNKNKKPLKLNNGDPMERMTGKGAQSLKESYNSVYEERTEEKVIDEGIMGALAKVGTKDKSPAKPAAAAAKPAAAGSAAAAAKPAAAGSSAAAAAKPAAPAKPSYQKDDVDLFDIIKGHFIEEGLTEEEALAKMFDLTDEERTEIIEGSCGSKKKKKSKKGGY